MFQSSTIALGDGGVLAVTGGALLVFGLLWVNGAYVIALLSEQFDAVGSKTPASEVEPTEWKVMFTRLVGVAMVLFGAWRIVQGVIDVL